MSGKIPPSISTKVSIGGSNVTARMEQTIATVVRKFFSFSNLILIALTAASVTFSSVRSFFRWFFSDKYVPR